MTQPASKEARASREAIDWLILLNDDPEDGERRAEFESWLAGDPAHAAAWAAHGQSYALLGQAPAELADQWRHAPRLDSSKPATGRVRPAIGTGSGRPWLRGKSRAIAAIAAACIAILLAPQAMLRLQADNMTTTAEIRRLTLPDGSIATLGPDSALQVRFAGVERDVRLLKGEAFFEVVHDPRHPFRVLSGQASTTVLGTAFDVKLRDDRVKVAVRRGHVRVRHEDGMPVVTEDLRPGQWAEMRWTGAIERGVQAPLIAGSWTGHRLMINDRPISEAVDDIRPWFAGKIILANSSLGARRVTGSVDTNDPAEAVRSLVGAQGGSVRRITPWLLIVS